jgi:hypothetical protein
MDRQRLQAWILRYVGTVEALAFGAVVMPRRWMEVTHEWLGLGTLPDAPVVNFILRQASFSYGLHGVALWFIAADVVRYRPLVLLTGWGYLVAGPVFMLIDWTSGMPWWWIVGDGGGCLVIGLLVLWLDPGRPRAIAE